MNNENLRRDGQAEGKVRRRPMTARVERRYAALVLRIQKPCASHAMLCSPGATDGIWDVLALPDSPGAAYFGAALAGLASGRLIAAVNVAMLATTKGNGRYIRAWRSVFDRGQVRRWVKAHPEPRD